MGKEVIYSADGKVIEGVIVKYYEEGKKMSETPYVNGLKNGTEIEYFYNGITPSNTGAQHMQVVEYKRLGVSTAHAPGAFPGTKTAVHPPGRSFPAGKAPVRRLPYP